MITIIIIISMSTNGRSKYYGLVPLGSSGSPRPVFVTRPLVPLVRGPSLCFPGGVAHQHLGVPTSIRFFELYAPPLILQLRVSLSYVGNSGSSTDLLIPDLIT
ncbi:jg21972 [Pararge aegeria aegeria]|uniref:Jg21972 protein n=1 Tax=Pararge aegeria aegeria TaxID=348720 RepID=A0A8S4RXX4_9NEOP|nr:jg21972 [Pararge aegeria aegeria]